MKTCTKFGKRKPVKKFYKHQSCKGKRHSQCIDCVREYKRLAYLRYYSANRTKVLAARHIQYCRKVGIAS